MSEPVVLTGLEEDERASVAAFPLPSVVLFPGTAVTLHLFEPRYREMARDVLITPREGVAPRVLAIAALEPGWETDYAGRPSLRTIACVGRVVDHRVNEDGTIDLALIGVERVSLVELPDGGRPYRRARAAPVAEIVEPASIAAAKTQLVAILRGLGVDVPADLLKADLGSALADRIADLTIADPMVRQRLLETVDVAARLRLVSDAVTERALGARTPRALN